MRYINFNVERVENVLQTSCMKVETGDVSRFTLNGHGKKCSR